MNEKLSQTQKLGRLIFFAFTRELIHNYGSSSVFKLNKIIEERGIRGTITKGNNKGIIKEEIKEKVHEIVLAKEEELEGLIRNEQFAGTKAEEFFPVPEGRKPIKKLTFKTPAKNIQDIQNLQQTQPAPRMRITIPETKLPERFNYLKPIPFEANIPLGKLDDLIKDPDVKIVECNGYDDNLIVKGNMGEQKTAVTLTKAEIDEIINAFSSRTKIPAHEGVYKVVFGKLILMAIISEAIGSRFIIKKMEQQRSPLPY